MLKIFRNLLAKLSITEVLLTGTAIIYAVGFLVTNLYLGSFGVVSFQFLKVKYFLVGILFVIFCSLILAPLIQLRKRLIERQNTWKRLTLLFGRSWEVFGTFMLIGLFVNSVFSFSRYPSLGNPDSSFLFSEWVVTEGVSVILTSLKIPLVVIIVIASLVVVALAILFLQKESFDYKIKKSRELLLDIWRFIVSYAFVQLLVLVLAYIAWNALSSWTSSNSIESVTKTHNWWRFIFGGFGLYFTIALYIFAYLPSPEDADKDVKIVSEEEFIGSIAMRLLLLFLFFMFIVLPVYSVAIYPYLPPQVGGGAPTPIKIILEETTYSQINNEGDTFLLDRTDSEIFIAVLDTSESPQVFSIPNNKVLYIHYLPAH